MSPTNPKKHNTRYYIIIIVTKNDQALNVEATCYLMKWHTQMKFTKTVYYQ